MCGVHMKVNRGFTIIELMITVGILAVVAAFAAPTFTSMVQRNKMDKVRDDLFADLVLARSEALARNKPVTVCATSNPTAVSPTCSNSNSWATGWLVFVDTDQDTVVDGEVDSDANGIAEVTADEYIRIYRSTDTSLKISWVPLNGTKQYVLFDRLGRMSEVNNGSFHFCNNSAAYAEKIVISKAGRARFEGGATCS